MHKACYLVIYLFTLSLCFKRKKYGRRLVTQTPGISSFELDHNMGYVKLRKIWISAHFQQIKSIMKQLASITANDTVGFLSLEYRRSVVEH